MTDKALKWTNTVALGATLVMNGLANLIKIGGNTTGDVAEKYKNLFTPAPITFAIWGVIYLLMAVFVLYQWGVLDSFGESDRVRDAVGLWFAVSCAANIAWLFCWHFDAIGLSCLCIIGLLVTLAVIAVRIGRIKTTGVSRLAANAGFDIYLGWIIAAVISNIAVWLTKIEWQRFGLSERFWTVAVLLIGAVIASAAVLFGNRWLTALTVVWAYAGVLIRHISPKYYAGEYPVVITVAIIAIVIILVTVIVENLWEMRREKAAM